ncbi:MAG: hypothetical protein HY290_24535 [Planctomycetia bacterium]|nr:hypothetical protein [Planctomycetia bacterium]
MSTSGLLPNRFLFRFSFPVRYERKLPRSGKKLLDLPADFALADLGELDQAAPFGELRLAWNERGLGISVAVEGKKHPLQCDRHSPETSDGLRLFIDTRNTQSIHRASRFCQQFFLIPAGGAESSDPWAVQATILRAREEAPRANVAEIRMSTAISKTGYRLEAWLPASVLHGYDPEAQARLGFYYALRDAELGEQFLSVGHDFPFAIDPSLWSTLELVGPS